MMNLERILVYNFNFDFINYFFYFIIYYKKMSDRN